MEGLHRGKGGVGAVGLDHGFFDLAQVLDNELDPAQVGLCGGFQDGGEDGGGPHAVAVRGGGVKAPLYPIRCSFLSPSFASLPI